jgi:hypothetical protein
LQQHCFRRRLCDSKRSANIQIDDEVEGLDINIDKRLRPIAARVVDENAQSVYRRNLFDELIVCDVGGPAIDPAGGMCANFRKVFLRTRYRNYLSARGREAFGTGPTNAAAGTGDESKLPVK